MNLSKKDRYIIANQLKILEKLDPEEADFYSKSRKAIEYGFKLHYSWIAEFIDDDEMNEEDSREVLDVLDMYRAMTFSLQRLKKENTNLSIKEEDVRFRGYDGNNETQQFSYVVYFISDLGRFEELKYESEYPDFNSHCPMIQTYKRMLAIWREYPNRYELDEDQIRKLLEA